MASVCQDRTRVYLAACHALVNIISLHFLSVEPLVLKCQNPECVPDTDLRQFDVRTVRTSLWQCPLCKYIYFYNHIEETL